MSTIGNVNDQLLSALRARREARDERVRLIRPIRIVDILLADLEEMNLAGRKRVPLSFERRLLGLASQLPSDLRDQYAPVLRSRITVAHLMDRLFELQDHLLFRKAGIRIDDDDVVVIAQAAQTPPDMPQAS